MSLKLSEMKIGDKGEISSVAAKGEIRRRLLDMGLVEGVRFKVLRVAPLGDPIIIRLRGFQLSLRREEAATIFVELLGHHHTGACRRRRLRADGALYSPQPVGCRKAISDRKEIVVALLGNPNSGKTSLFNNLVGAHQRVGNFTGVTIEKYEGSIKYRGYKIRVIDLPGTYSLTAYSPEELVARNFLIEEKPDIVIDVVDGSNLERNLYLTTQLMELEVDMLVALNMYDEVKKQQIKIDLPQLQKLLGSHIIPTSSVKKQGFAELLDHIVRVYEGQISIAKNKLTYSADIEEKISALADALAKDEQLVQFYSPRWLAIKLLENDQQIYQAVKERAVWVKAEVVLKQAIAGSENQFEGDPELAITEDRHSFIRGALKETVVFPKEIKKTLTDYIDGILINRLLGLPIFLLIMWLIFQFTFKLGELPMGWIESFFGWLGNLVAWHTPDGLFRSVLVDGIIAGVGGILVFLPNILLLFIAISFLEGSGYMSRAAFVIDKVMHHFGLHGKSFIPMMTGFGCSVPAFMACRTLKNDSDRLTTMMVIPFMSCGAKLPVYVLLISAFFTSGMAGNVLFGIYIFGVIVAVLSAKLLKRAVFKGESEPFVMELPPYRFPTLRALLFQTWFKAKMYLKKAGTTILIASIIIWLATNFPQSEIKHKEERVQQSYQLEQSYAGRFGKAIEPVIKPLGFDWRIGVALTAGLAAKEIVVSTLGTIYSLGEVDESSVDLSERLREDPKFNRAVALSLMVFVLLYVPCFAATAVFHKEAGRKKWTAIYIAYSMSVAWLLSFLVYHLAKLFI